MLDKIFIQLIYHSLGITDKITRTETTGRNIFGFPSFFAICNSGGSLAQGSSEKPSTNEQTESVS